jgi:hypothetical protein
MRQKILDNAKGTDKNQNIACLGRRFARKWQRGIWGDNDSGLYLLLSVTA